MPKKVGIFGGSFNPVHIGHVKTAKFFLEKLKLDKVLFIPNFISVDKEKIKTSPTHRLKMLKIALKNQKWAEINLSEFERQGKSYTIDTINHLKKQNPNDEFYLLIGADCLNNFKNWFKWQDILQKVRVCVISRNNHQNNDNELIKKILFLPMDKINISSSRIRKNNKNYDNLNPEVSDYIKKNNLYTISNE